MKEIGILYSTPMILAKLADRKTVTRRPISPQPIDNKEVDGNFFEGNHKGYVKVDGHPDWQKQFAYEFAKWQPGDIVYARETYYQKGYWIKDGLTKKGNQKWKFVNTDRIVLYENNKPENYRKSRDKKNPSKIHWYKRLGRFMPKGYARIYERVISVRPERLQDITDEDAVREGLQCMSKDKGITYKYGIPDSDGQPGIDDHGWPWQEWEVNPINAFKKLWQSIHGPDSWEENLWVWRIETEALSTTGRPANL